MDIFISEYLKNFRSTNTKSAYQNDLNQFLKFCSVHANAELTHPSQITETMCIMWKHHVYNIPNQTIARKMASLSSFLKFCQRKKLITTNPVEFLKRPKISNVGKTNILTKTECMQVFECIQKHIQYYEMMGNEFQYKLWKKRYAVLYILFTVGMRVEELCKLKFEDLEKIDSNLYRLHLTAKGNEKHSPLIHIKTAHVILDYMKLSEVTQRGQSIFQNIHRSNVLLMVKICVKKAGITKKVSPHSLRASLATHLHNTGVPIGHIKDLLNHKNIATTLLYTRVSEDELKENASLLSLET